MIRKINLPIINMAAAIVEMAAAVVEMVTAIVEMVTALVKMPTAEKNERQNGMPILFTVKIRIPA